MLNENFAILGFLVTFAGGLTYILDTVRGKIQPNRVSWFLWALAPFLTLAAQISQGVGLQFLLTFAIGFIPAMVFLSSFLNKKAFWKIEKFDLFCGALSVLGLVLWMVTKVGNVAIFFGIFADGMASLPTLFKAWKEPKTESPYVFLANTASAVITMLTIKTWNFETAAFSIYVFLMMGAIAATVKMRQRKLF